MRGECHAFIVLFQMRVLKTSRSRHGRHRGALETGFLFFIYIVSLSFSLACSYFEARKLAKKITVHFAQLKH